MHKLGHALSIAIWIYEILKILANMAIYEDEGFECFRQSNVIICLQWKVVELCDSNKNPHKLRKKW